MLEGALGGLITVLALLGGAGLFVRLLRTAGRVALRAAEVAAASGRAEAGARRGDLTAMTEGGAAARRGKSAMRREALLALLLLLWIAVPLALGAAAEAYAVAAPLWLLPSAPLRAADSELR